MRNSPRMKISLIWHEAGNALYQDRFLALSKVAGLTVYGLKKFQHREFEVHNKTVSYRLKLYNASLSSHWLTYISVKLIYDLIFDDADIIYLHEEPHSLIAFLIALTNPRKLIIVDSALINFKGSFSGMNIFENFVYRKAAGVFHRNQAVAKVLLKRGCPSSKLLGTLGNGVSFETFCKIDKNEARARLLDRYPQVGAVFTHTPILGFAGRIWEPKGLRSLDAVINSGTYGVLMCGETFSPDLAIWLRSRGVVLLPKLDLDDLRLFYSAIDLFVLPSVPTVGWEEQFGRVLIESISCGTPAIGSNLGAIPAILGPTAVFEPGNSCEILAMAERLLDAASRQELLGIQQKITSESFTWDALTSKVEKVCKEFLSLESKVRS